MGPNWRFLRLAGGAMHGSSADDDRRRAAVVADGQVLVIRGQRISGAEEIAYIRGVIERGEEIGVVTNHRGQAHRYTVARDQQRLHLRALRRSGLQQFGDAAAERRPVVRAQRE